MYNSVYTIMYVHYIYHNMHNIYIYIQITFWPVGLSDISPSSFGLRPPRTALAGVALHRRGVQFLRGRAQAAASAGAPGAGRGRESTKGIWELLGDPSDGFSFGFPVAKKKRLVSPIGDPSNGFPFGFYFKGGPECFFGFCFLLEWAGSKRMGSKHIFGLGQKLR